MRETIVIKLSGRMMSKLKELVPQIKEVRKKMNVIIVHGAKEQLNELSRKMGVEPKFVEGRRVTDEKMLELCKMSFCKLTIDFVEALENARVTAVGINGVDGGTLVGTADEQTGFEGTVTMVRPNLIRELMEKYVVVVTPLIYDWEKQSALNVDADDTATKIAKKLGARMMLIGEAKGVMGKDGKVIDKIGTRELNKLIEEGTISGGMIPKVKACIEARLPKVWFVDGNEKNVILRALAGEKVGTTIVGS